MPESKKLKILLEKQKWQTILELEIVWTERARRWAERTQKSLEQVWAQAIRLPGGAGIWVGLNSRQAEVRVIVIPTEEEENRKKDSVKILEAVVTALSVEVIDGIVYSFNKYILRTYNDQTQRTNKVPVYM